MYYSGPRNASKKLICDTRLRPLDEQSLGKSTCGAECMGALIEERTTE